MSKSLTSHVKITPKMTLTFTDQGHFRRVQGHSVKL